MLTNCLLENTEPPAKKRKTLPKILDGKYFAVDSNNDGKLLAKCTECNEMKKGYISSTGNFINHYKSKHPSQVKSLEEYLKKINVDKTNDRTTNRQASIPEIVQGTSDERVCV